MSGDDPRYPLDPQACAQGDAFRWVLTFQSTSAGGAPLPVDLTAFGSTWTSNLRISPSQVPPLSFTIDASGAATGVLVLSLTGAQTGTMATDPAAGTVWQFDLQVAGGSLSPYTPYKGLFTVYKVITHA